MARRVVAGHRNGESSVLADGKPPLDHEFASAPGMSVALLWAGSSAPKIGQDDAAESVTDETAFLPGVGETRVLMMTVPPDAWASNEGFDPIAVGTEYAENFPEMAAVQEPDGSGMHRTETVDYFIMVEGELWIELDNQEEVHLKPADVLILEGGRHVWHNKGDKVATLAGILVGAERGAR